MAPPKLPPRKLGTVAPSKNSFRAEVRLDGITEIGPRRARRADACADLALVRACQTREEIPAFLALLRAEVAHGKLGGVVRNRRGFRVHLRLNGISETGPRRTRKADARVDLDLVRACQTREEIPAFLGLLRAAAAYSNARSLSNARAASQGRPDVVSPAVSRRECAVVDASRLSRAEAGMASAKRAPGKFGAVVPNHRRPLGGARRGKSQDEDEERAYKRCMTAWNAFVAENSGGQLRSSRPVYDLSEQPVSQLAT